MRTLRSSPCRRLARLAATLLGLVVLGSGCGEEAAGDGACDAPGGLWQQRVDEGGDEQAFALTQAAGRVVVVAEHATTGAAELVVQGFTAAGAEAFRQSLGESGGHPSLAHADGTLWIAHGAFLLVRTDAGGVEIDRQSLGSTFGDASASVRAVAVGSTHAALVGGIVTGNAANKQQAVALVLVPRTDGSAAASSFPVDARCEGRAVAADAGGWVIAGWREALVGDVGRQGLLLAVDADGVQRWQRSLGGVLDDEFAAVTVDPAGGLLAAGNSRSASAGGADAWIVHTDADGQALWERRYGGESEDGALALWADASGRVVAGRRNSTDLAPGGAWIAGIDADGILRWERTFDGSWKADARGLLRIGPRLFAAGASSAMSDSGASDLWLRALGSDGEETCAP